MSAFSDAFHTVVREIKSIALDIFSAFFNAGVEAARQIGPVLLQSATDAVLAVETTPGDGKVKREAAFAAIVADLESKGLPIVKNAINLAIEAAVANMKSSAATAPTPQVTGG